MDTSTPVTIHSHKMGQNRPISTPDTDYSVITLSKIYTIQIEYAERLKHSVIPYVWAQLRQTAIRKMEPSFQLSSLVIVGLVVFCAYNDYKSNTIRCMWAHV